MSAESTCTSTPPAIHDDADVSRDAVWTGLAQITNAVSGLALVILAAQVFTVEAFAALNWGLSSVIYLAALARVGGMQAGTFATVAASPGARRETIRKLALSGLGAGSIVAACWLTISLFAAQWETQQHLAEQFGLVLAITVPFATVLPVLVAAIRGLGDFRTAAVFGEHFHRIAAILAISGFALAGTLDDDPSRAVSATFGAALAAYLFACAATLSVITKTTQGPSERVKLSEVLRTSQPFYLIGFAAIVIPQGAVWLLALVSTEQDVAEFGLAARLSFAFTLPFAIGGRVFFPRMVDQLELRPPRLLERLRQFSTIATLGGLTMLLLLLVARPLFPIVFGADLADAFWPLVVLAAGALANTATGLCMAALSATGHSRLVARASGLTVWGYSVAVLALGHWLGAMGAAIATAISTVGLNGSMWLTLRRLVDIDTSARFRRSTLVADLRSFGGLR